MAGTATINAEELAELLGVSPWTVYQSARTQQGPIGTLAIKVGRRVLWPKAAVDRLLALEVAAGTEGMEPPLVPASHPNDGGSRCPPD